MSNIKLKEKLRSSQLMLGTWSQSSSAEILEIVGYAGFDFTIIDTEHGHFDLETAVSLVRAAEAASISSMIRVAANEPHLIMKALDIGAEGVLIPQITDRAQAEKAVSAARYFPQGTRGACPCIRAGQHYITEWNRYAERSNDDIVVMALVEGQDGIANIEQIIATPHLDAIMVGPFDLSVSLGVGGRPDHPLVADFIRRVVSLSQQHGVMVCIPNFDLDIGETQAAIDKWQELGCRNFTIGTDKLFFADHMTNINRVIKEHSNETN